MNSRRAHYPTPIDVDEVLRELEADEQRQKEALRRFYARNSTGHYSKVRFPSFGFWCGMFFAGVVTAFVIWRVITAAIDGTLGAFGQ